MLRLRCGRGSLWLLVVGMAAVALLAGGCQAHAAPRGQTQTASRHAFAPGITWQWQLDGKIDTSITADLYDLDLFETDPETVDNLHRMGRTVICYLSAGTFEDWRPDAAAFPAAVLGQADAGWQGERWLDVRQISALAPILAARLDLCRSKGFDGVEADNVDGYSNTTGFPISAADQSAFNRWLAAAAHQRGLSIGLKNDPEQVTALEPDYDWALAEECFKDDWCEDERPFTVDGKPVLSAEYVEDGIDHGAYCRAATTLGLSAIIKHRSLDARRETC